MDQSLIQNFNHLSEELRFSDAGRIARNPALMDRLEEAAKQAAEKFPELDNLVVLPVPGWGAPLFATDKVMAALTVEVLKDRNLQQSLKYNPEMVQKLIDDGIQQLIRKKTRELDGKTRDDGTVAFANEEIAGIPVKIIALVSSNNFKVKFPDGYTDEMAALGVIDRAIGQLVSGDEDVAAAYEAMKHRQRYPGQNTDYALYRSEAAAAALILNGDISRYTPDSLESAFNEADNIGTKFYTLSPRETMDIAETISDESLMTAETLYRLQDVFKPVTDYYQKNHKRDNTDVLKEVYAQVIDIMRKNQADPDVVRLAQRFLSHPQTQAFLLDNAKELLQRTVVDFINNHDPKPKAHQLRHAAPRPQA